METPPQSPRVLMCPGAPMKQNNMYTTPPQSPREVECPGAPMKDCPDMYECDDCNKKGINCLENLGLSQHEINVYWDAGEPDRCDECFEKWISSEDEDIQDIVRMMD